MVDFLSKLSPKARQRLRWHDEQIQKAARMEDIELIQKLDYYIENSELGCRWQPGDPVYDAALKFVFLPEFIQRFKQKANYDPKQHHHFLCVAGKCDHRCKKE